MSFSISRAKVEESLATTAKPLYAAMSIQISAENLFLNPTPSSSVNGTMMPDVARSSLDTREYVLSLRRKIEESGVRLKDVAELDHEIDEVKGRKNR